jgi:hypothetical protein
MYLATTEVRDPRWVTSNHWLGANADQTLQASKQQSVDIFNCKSYAEFLDYNDNELILHAGSKYVLILLNT